MSAGAKEIRDESAARVHKRTPAAATTLTPDWHDLARSLAFWLDKHVDPPNGSTGCPETCDARRVLAKYREAEARRG